MRAGENVVLGRGRISECQNFAFLLTKVVSWSYNIKTPETFDGALLFWWMIYWCCIWQWQSNTVAKKGSITLDTMTVQYWYTIHYMGITISDLKHHGPVLLVVLLGIEYGWTLAAALVSVLTELGALFVDLSLIQLLCAVAKKKKNITFKNYCLFMYQIMYSVCIPNELSLKRWSPTCIINFNPLRVSFIMYTVLLDGTQFILK